MSSPSWRLLLLGSLLLTSFLLHAQNFRGDIKGTVEDASGAALPDAAVRATNKNTGLVRSTVSSSAGEFSFPDLPLGTYTVSATKDGFQEQKSGDVEVVVSRVSAVNFKLQVAQQAVSVDVSAAVAAIETVSTALTGVVNTKTVEDLPLNGRDFRQMLKLSPGVNPNGNSVNGNRTRGNNYMIDGADNNDGFQNTSAVNQGGVSGIAGTLLPVEAIDQFSVSTNGSAELGRNGGGIVNLVIKSGTNEFHGSGYYYNRNEAFAEPSPFAPVGASARRIRNGQGGFSLGGPIIRNKLFFFSTGEMQKADAANAQPVTTPSPAWVDAARAVLARYGETVNPVSQNLLSFWPARTRTGGAVANNFTSTDSNIYDSYNGIVKIDWNVNDRHNLAGRYYGGTGKQVALVNNNAPFLEYFQVAPSRMHNVSIVLNSVLTPRLVNQLVLGGNYFLQTFNDYDISPNPIAAGLNTGVTEESLRGAPTINVTNFAQVSATQPLGRIDTTGHITNTATLTVGRHQLKLGGEYRKAVLDIFYDANKRGAFNFDGTQGPWANDATVSAALRSLSDFLTGRVRGSNGSQIVLGPLQRDYRQNSFDLFAHDNFQVTPRLNVNFGVRYTYLGPLSEKDNSITTFIPGRGIVAAGIDIDSLYEKDWNNFSPRFGFAFTPKRGGNTVIRGAYGVFFDTPAVSFFASNNPGNGGAAGVNGNPGGPTPVYNVVRSGYTIQSGVNPFGGGAPAPPYGAFSVSQDFATPYIQNFSVNVQQQVWTNGVVQVGYVGSLGRKLPITRNINTPLPFVGEIPPAANRPSLQDRRPFRFQHPDLATINQLESIGNSSFNSLQVQFTQSLTKGLTTQFAYTYAKAIDLSSEARNTLVTDSYNVRLDRGPAAFDLRHNMSMFASYSLPTLTGRLPRRLVEGWQLNALITAHTGTPFTLLAGTDRSLTGNFTDRVDLVGDPYATDPIIANSRNRRWLNPAAFAAPAFGAFGNLGRNILYGPGFASVDPSIFKNTRITERVSLQLRAEFFNIFNKANYANPGTSLNSATTFGVITNTRNGGSAPGLGFGEPRNIQLVAKIVF